jgi:2'-5' RNA ligase
MSFKLVGAIGFEPTTPCAQGRCATRLRYAPTILSELILKHVAIFFPLCAQHGSAGPRQTKFARRDPSPRAALGMYNLQPGMPNLRYALVAYLRNAAGEFVENLRRELHPDLPHLPAHLTILPPRTLQGSETEALQVLERICGQEQPFEVHLGKVESFIPVTPTVYIQIDGQASRMHELHARLNINGLCCTEEWPYIPHLTIAKMSSEEPARNAMKVARERWAAYRGSRCIFVENLTFVREDAQNEWVDLAPVPLGRRLVSR